MICNKVCKKRKSEEREMTRSPQHLPGVEKSGPGLGVAAGTPPVQCVFQVKSTRETDWVQRGRSGTSQCDSVYGLITTHFSTRLG